VIDTLSVQLLAAWRGTSWIEIVAAVLAVLYVVLAIRQSIACWAAAFVSSCLYVWVMFGAHLYMESVLNAFYAVMAVYGYLQWRGGASGQDAGGGARKVHRWSWTGNLLAAGGVLLLSSVSWYFLRLYTPSPSPFLDSMVAWASVFATVLVARKVYENWHWWLCIDSICMCLYVTRHLDLTALLFALYVALCVVGMREWRRSLPLPHAA
jgi:nicotinamide mononucleotide transporter